MFLLPERAQQAPQVHELPVESRQLSGALQFGWQSGHVGRSADPGGLKRFRVSGVVRHRGAPRSNTTRAARAAQGCTEDVRMGAGDKTHE